MPTIWGYFAFDFLFGDAGPLQPPHDLRFAHASAYGAGQVSLNWAWERPDEIGPGATDVTYQTEVQELSAGGAGSIPAWAGETRLDNHIPEMRGSIPAWAGETQGI